MKDKFCYNAECIAHVDCDERIIESRRLKVNLADFEQRILTRQEYIKTGKSLFFCDVCMNVIKTIKQAAKQKDSADNCTCFNMHSMPSGKEVVWVNPDCPIHG